MSRRANFEYLMVTPKVVLIKDMGPWDKHLSVTNDVENVVTAIGVDMKAPNFIVAAEPECRIFCIDTEGDVNELHHRDFVFESFSDDELPAIVRLIREELTRSKIEASVRARGEHPDYEAFDKQARIREAMHDDNYPRD